MDNKYLYINYMVDNDNNQTLNKALTYKINGTAQVYSMWQVYNYEMKQTDKDKKKEMYELVWRRR